MLASQRLNPSQPDVRNSLGVIFAEEGKTVRAWLVWRELVREVPDYEPARRNLTLLGSKSRLPVSRRRPLPAPWQAVVKATEDERKPHLPVSEIPPDRRNQVESNHGRTSSN